MTRYAASVVDGGGGPEASYQLVGRPTVCRTDWAACLHNVIQRSLFSRIGHPPAHFDNSAGDPSRPFRLQRIKPVFPAKGYQTGVRPDEKAKSLALAVGQIVTQEDGLTLAFGACLRFAAASRSGQGAEGSRSAFSTIAASILICVRLWLPLGTPASSRAWPITIRSLAGSC
jgi:hypothetical protein